ncbi:hypothetical protein Patl1_27184 [Pistacia atlantica]|uniref:Uncharacterized protein n=1 Tax=Pistacia atlantica TaxID=434234 RepID=A0ACC1BF14_9ROSI|nr:hypothetical protein Patl1_27184 [Pistacia atlantica]
MARSALDEVSDSGSFVRPASTFCNSISRDPSSQFPAESGSRLNRYGRKQRKVMNIEDGFFWLRIRRNQELNLTL